MPAFGATMGGAIASMFKPVAFTNASQRSYLEIIEKAYKNLVGEDAPDIKPELGLLTA